MTRQAKTPRQRAQEALDVEERRVTKLRAQLKKHESAARAVETDLNSAIARRDHLRTHPDLKTGNPAGSTTTPTGATS